MERRLSSVVLAALMLFVAGRCLVPMDETDLFFNLRLGEIVLATGRVPTTNLLSFTYPDHADVNLAWVFQVLLALAHRAGGIAGTVLLKTTMVLVVFGVLWSVARRRGAHPGVAAAVLALAAWAAEPRFVERPHLVTFVGIALLLLALERAEAGRPRGLWALVPAGLLWANANSCFFLAPAILLLYAAGCAADSWWSRRLPAPNAGLGESEGTGPIQLSGPALGNARRAALVALAMSPLVLATPSGTGALGYIANHFRMPWVRPLQEYRVAEWPLDGPFVFLAGVLLLVAAVAPARARLRWLLPAAVLAFLGWRRIRFVAEFALVAAPAAAALATAALQRLPRVDRIPRRVHALATGAVAAGLLTLTAWPRVVDARAGKPMLALAMENDLVPVEAIKFAEGNGLRDRMYNDMEVGSYLTWDGWPRYRVFQDPRINGYPEELHGLMRRTNLVTREWEAFLEKHAVTTALMSYPAQNPRVALFDPERWAPVYRSRDALIMVRRLPQWDAALAAHELPLRFSWSGSTMVHPVEKQRADTTVRHCEWQRRLGDFYMEVGASWKALRAYRVALSAGMECIEPTARQALMITVAGLQTKLGGPQEAVELLTGLPDPVSKSNRGFALLSLKRASEALADFDDALKIDPGNLEALYGRAVALDALARKTEAVAALRAFLAVAPDEHMAVTAARQRLEELVP